MGNESRQVELYNKLLKANNEGILKISNPLLTEVSLGKMTSDQLDKLEMLYNDKIKMAKERRLVDDIRGFNILNDKYDISSMYPKARDLFNIWVSGGTSESLKNNEGYYILNGIYFHGKLETKLEYDIVYANKSISIEEFISKDSVHLRVINTDTEELYHAIGFFWKDKSNNINRGLIVNIDDYDAIKYAVEMKEKQSSML